MKAAHWCGCDRFLCLLLLSLQPAQLVLGLDLDVRRSSVHAIRAVGERRGGLNGGGHYDWRRREAASMLEVSGWDAHVSRFPRKGGLIASGGVRTDMTAQRLREVPINRSLKLGGILRHDAFRMGEKFALELFDHHQIYRSQLTRTSLYTPQSTPSRLRKRKPKQNLQYVDVRPPSYPSGNARLTSVRFTVNSSRMFKRTRLSPTGTRSSTSESRSGGGNELAY